MFSLLQVQLSCRLYMYFTDVMAGQLDQVRLQDFIWTKNFMRDEDFANVTCPEQIRNLVKILQDSWTSMRYGAENAARRLADAHAFIELAVQFKESLAVSPYEYAICFAPPNDKYSKDYMQLDNGCEETLADTTGKQCRSVAICVFPALYRLENVPETSVYCSERRVLYTAEEMKQIIADDNAVVLEKVVVRLQPSKSGA